MDMFVFCVVCLTVFVNCFVKQFAVFGTLVGVFVFSVMWSVLMMTSANSCPLRSSVYKCQRVESGFTYPVRTSVACLWCTVCSVVCPCQLF